MNNKYSGFFYATILPKIAIYENKEAIYESSKIGKPVFFNKSKEKYKLYENGGI